MKLYMLAFLKLIHQIKGLLEEIVMNEKHHYLDLLNNTKYDEVKGVMDHIMLLSSYYNKVKGLKMDIGEEFLTYSIMKSLPSQFDNIRSSYNTEKEVCSLEELTVIFVKEVDDIKLNRLRFVAMVSHQVDKSKKSFRKKRQGFKPNEKKFSSKKSKGPKDVAYHMKERKEYFNRRCSYYKKVEHKKIDYWKLKGK